MGKDHGSAEYDVAGRTHALLARGPHIALRRSEAQLFESTGTPALGEVLHRLLPRPLKPPIHHRPTLHAPGVFVVNGHDRYSRTTDTERIARDPDPWNTKSPIRSALVPYLFRTQPRMHTKKGRHSLTAASCTQCPMHPKGGQRGRVESGRTATSESHLSRAVPISSPGAAPTRVNRNNRRTPAPTTRHLARQEAQVPTAASKRQPVAPGAGHVKRIPRRSVTIRPRTTGRCTGGT
jgi:hypothetical protein